MRISLGVVAAFLLGGCAVSLPEGRFSCSLGSDCPDGWSCVDGRCLGRPSETPDAGTPESGTDDAAVAADAPDIDAARIDASGADDDCDGIDDDRDGRTDEAASDEDGDGATVCVDCDDTNAEVSPLRAETCADGIDNDCSGAPESEDECCPGSGSVLVAPSHPGRAAVCASVRHPPATCIDAQDDCHSQGGCLLIGEYVPAVCDGVSVEYWGSPGFPVFNSDGGCRGWQQQEDCDVSPLVGPGANGGSRSFHCAGSTALPSYVRCESNAHCPQTMSCVGGACVPRGEPWCCLDAHCASGTCQDFRCVG